MERDYHSRRNLQVSQRLGQQGSSFIRRGIQGQTDSEWESRVSKSGMAEQISECFTLRSSYPLEEPQRTGCMLVQFWLKSLGLGKERVFTSVWLTSIFVPVGQQGQTIQLIIHEAQRGNWEGECLALLKGNKEASVSLICHIEDIFCCFVVNHFQNPNR